MGGVISCKVRPLFFVLTVDCGGDILCINYRGYYLDGETGLQYLNARYYDPEIGRFISADSIAYLAPETVNGLKLFVYCLNNPLMYTDPYGTTAWWEWLLLGIGAAVVVAVAVVATVATGGIALIAGGIAIGGALLGLANIAGQGLTKGWSNINIGQVGTSILNGAAFGGFMGFLGSGAAIGGSLALAGGGTVSIGLSAYNIFELIGAGSIILYSWNSSHYCSSKIGSNRHYNKQFSDFFTETDYKIKI